MDYILYHANCQDGWVAAYIAKKKWPEAELVPLSYGLTKAQLDDLFEATFHKDVFMVDYSFPTRELMEQLHNTTKSLRVLDHHISKKDVLADFNFATFDNERSGAGLAWDYLFGKDIISGIELPRPWWVSYTEDQDLWRWKLHNSRCVNAFLMVQRRDILTWDVVTEAFDPIQAAAAGQHVNSHTEFVVNSLMHTVQEGRFHGYKTGVINTSVAVSEALEAVYYSGFDIGMSWYERANGDISFGLRSTKVDVGAIAKQYGGGGHKASAGFELSLEKGREIIDTVLGRREEIETHGTSRCCR